MNEEYFYFYFWIFEFLLLSLPWLSILILFPSLHWQKSHFHAFIFDLNSSRDLAFLYLVCQFAQRNGARYVTVSVPYLTVFLFSVKISWKFLMLFVLQRSWKREFIIGGAIPFTILYTSVIKTCKFLWWIVISFCSLSICWKSLVSSLYVSLRPLS